MARYSDPDPPVIQPYRSGEYQRRLDAQLAAQAKKDAAPKRFKGGEPVVCEQCEGYGTKKGCKLCGVTS